MSQTWNKICCDIGHDQFRWIQKLNVYFPSDRCKFYIIRVWVDMLKKKPTTYDSLISAKGDWRFVYWVKYVFWGVPSQYLVYIYQCRAQLFNPVCRVKSSDKLYKYRFLSPLWMVLFYTYFFSSKDSLILKRDVSFYFIFNKQSNFVLWKKHVFGI